MSYKVTDTIIVDQSRNLGSIGVATFSGPVIIGSGTSTRITLTGDISATGIVTSSVLVATKNPGTGIATDYTNSIFGNGWRVSSPASTTYFKLATLPDGGAGNTFDHLIINGTLGAWLSNQQTPFEIYFSNRNTFTSKYISYGSVRSDVRILAISTSGVIEIWAQHQATAFTKLVYSIKNSLQVIPVLNPVSTTTAPVGTTVFDSSTATPRFIINDSDNVGIGTISPQGALQIGVGATFSSTGNAAFTGIVTANSFRGDGSLLTGVGGALAISTNTTNSNQLIPYATSFGSTTGLGATSLFVYNPSNKQIGIGTTNPFASSGSSGIDVVGGSPIIFSRNTSLTSNSESTIWSADGDWFSIPSYKGVGLRNFSPTYTGNIFSGIGYSGGGALAFQNTQYGLIYTNGASPLIFATLSTEALRIDTLQRVGIGTNNPFFKSDVSGDLRIRSSNTLRFGGTAGTTNFYIQYNSTTNSLDFVAG